VWQFVDGDNEVRGRAGVTETVPVACTHSKAILGVGRQVTDYVGRMLQHQAHGTLQRLVTTARDALRDTTIILLERWICDQWVTQELITCAPAML